MECFSSPGIGLGRDIIVFGVGMSLSTKIDNWKKDILILGSLHYNGANSYLLVNGKETHRFNTKIFCDCSNPIMSRKHFKSRVSRSYEKTGLNGYVYDFRVDVIAVDDILYIHNYLMKKNNIV